MNKALIASVFLWVQGACCLMLNGQVQYYDITLHKGIPQAYGGAAAAASQGEGIMRMMQFQEAQRNAEMQNELLKLKIEEQRQKMDAQQGSSVNPESRVTDLASASTTFERPNTQAFSNKVEAISPQQESQKKAIDEAKISSETKELNEALSSVFKSKIKELDKKAELTYIENTDYFYSAIAPVYSEIIKDGNTIYLDSAADRDSVAKGKAVWKFVHSNHVGAASARENCIKIIEEKLK